MSSLTLYLYDQDLAFSMNISSMALAVLFLMCRVDIIVWLSHFSYSFSGDKILFYVYITFFKVSRETLRSHYPGIQER